MSELWLIGLVGLGGGRDRLTDEDVVAYAHGIITHLTPADARRGA